MRIKFSLLTVLLLSATTITLIGCGGGNNRQGAAGKDSTTIVPEPEDTVISAWKNVNEMPLAFLTNLFDMKGEENISLYMDKVLKPKGFQHFFKIEDQKTIATMWAYNSTYDEIAMKAVAKDKTSMSITFVYGMDNTLDFYFHDKDILHRLTQELLKAGYNKHDAYNDDDGGEVEYYLPEKVKKDGENTGIYLTTYDNDTFVISLKRFN